MPEGTRAGLDRSVEVRRVSSFLEEQWRILEAVATGTPLDRTLDAIARAVEAQAPGARVSILFVEGARLRHGAAPSLPDAYNRAIDGVEIGPTVGSCGAAAATGRPVVVEDVRTHPNWEPFRALTAAHGLRACWSTPILGRAGEVVGTFAIYHEDPRGPRPHEESVVAAATHLASLAIQNASLLRREAERIAKERERAEVRRILTGAPVAIAIVEGPDFVFTFANAAYERLVGRRVVEGKRVVDLFPEIQDQGLVDLLRMIYTTGEPYEFADLRVELDRGNGREEAWFTGRTEPYRDEEGRVRGLISTSVEVTHHLRARRELDERRAQIATQEKLGALGQLVSGVAHEIRTPLTYVATNLHIIELRLDKLRRTLPPTPAEECKAIGEQHLASAFEGIERINHIVEELRGFTHLRGGSREPARVADVVAQAVSLFEVTHRGSATVRYEAATEEVLVVDKLQVQQALLNLLQNALEAQPRDPTIRVRAFDEGDRVVIEVADTGRGIPVEARPRVFDPFFTTREGGTGLGLSIVKRVVDDHGGKVGFDTGPEGTRFRLAFPRPAKSP